LGGEPDIKKAPSRANHQVHGVEDYPHLGVFSGEGLV